MTVETLRYYERLGLLATPSRTTGGVRRYPENVVGRAAFVKQAQSLGLTLKDIQQLVRFRPGHGRAACKRIRHVLAARITDLDTRLVELQTFRATLCEHLRACDEALGDSGDAERPTLDALTRGAS